MWISRLALIYIRTGFILDNFTPKLWAKVDVVLILTLNSIAIRKYAVPRLTLYNCAPADITVSAMLPLSLTAGVSTASWLMALALGSSVFLKTGSAALFLVLLPASYIAAIALSILAVVVFKSSGQVAAKPSP